jgi:hypothetical protein
MEVIAICVIEQQIIFCLLSKPGSGETTASSLSNTTNGDS